MLNKLYHLYFCVDKSVRITPERPYSPPNAHPHTVTPRKSVPIPTRYEPPQFDVSPIPADAHNQSFPGDHDETVQSEFHGHFYPKKSPLKQITEDEHVSLFGVSYILYSKDTREIATLTIRNQSFVSVHEQFTVQSQF